MFDPASLFAGQAPLPQAVMGLGLMMPPPALLALVVPDFGAVVAGLIALGAAWKTITDRMKGASSGDPSDCPERLRKCHRRYRGMADAYDDSEQRRRHAESINDELRKRLEILERYLDGEGDRHPRDRGSDHDRP